MNLFSYLKLQSPTKKNSKLSTMKNLLTALFILLATTLFAQQDALFSQYMFNKLAVNPGYAGSREILSTDLLYRYQWVNIEGAPKTISASIHSPLVILTWRWVLM